MTQDPSVELIEEHVKLNVVVEETFEELEERTAPKLAANHNETLVLDLEDFCLYGCFSKPLHIVISHPPAAHDWP